MTSIPGVRLQPSLGVPAGDHAAGRTWGLQVLRHGYSEHAQVLRPRGVPERLALAPFAMLPSVSTTTSAPRSIRFSRLNSWPARTPVNAWLLPRLPTYPRVQRSPQSTGLPSLHADPPYAPERFRAAPESKARTTAFASRAARSLKG